jgi:hypothetical protein
MIVPARSQAGVTVTGMHPYMSCGRPGNACRLASDPLEQQVTYPVPESQAALLEFR